MKLVDWKLKLGKMMLVWVEEVRGEGGGSSLDSGGVGGLVKKECLFLGFFIFRPPARLCIDDLERRRYKERYKVGQGRQAKR
jgi:hypothetical protein